MTNSSFKALSTICSNIASVFFASMVVPVLIARPGSLDLKVIVLGLVMTIGSGLLSMFYAEKGKL